MQVPIACSKFVLVQFYSPFPTLCGPDLHSLILRTSGQFGIVGTPAQTPNLSPVQSEEVHRDYYPGMCACAAGVK